MERQDDLTIAGDLMLLRRIPPWGDRVIWEDDGSPTPTSFNFKDAADELSMHIASETTFDEVLAGHEGFGLVWFTAEKVREACGAKIIICRCVEEPEMGHVLICGKISGGSAKKLQRAATWAEGKWPDRNPPPPPIEVGSGR